MKSVEDNKFGRMKSVEDNKFGCMRSVEDTTSPPRKRISYKVDKDDEDSTSLHSATSVLSLDSEIDEVKKSSEMVS